RRSNADVLQRRPESVGIYLVGTRRPNRAKTSPGRRCGHSGTAAAFGELDRGLCPRTGLSAQTVAARPAPRESNTRANPETAGLRFELSRPLFAKRMPRPKAMSEEARGAIPLARL